MNALHVLDHVGSVDEEALSPAPHQMSEAIETHEAPPSFGQCQARALPLTVLTVFAFATVGIYLLNGELLAAIGLGAFIAFWIGGGFGFLIGGVLWGLGFEHE